MMWPPRGLKSDLPDGGSGDSSIVASSYIRRRAHLLLHPLHWCLGRGVAHAKRLQDMFPDSQRRYHREFSAMALWITAAM